LRKERKQQEEPCPKNEETVCKVEDRPVDDALEPEMNPIADCEDWFILSTEWCMPAKRGNAETIVEVSKDATRDARKSDKKNRVVSDAKPGDSNQNT
jgi:hypothetical protein